MWRSWETLTSPVHCRGHTVGVGSRKYGGGIRTSMTTLKSCKWKQRKGAVAGRSHEVKVLVFVLMWENIK